MSGPRVTVALVPRERFSHTDRTLRSVLKNTHIDYDLVYVDGKSPVQVKDTVSGTLERAGAKVIALDSYVSPNQARNMAANAASTEYIVFLDNDTLVAPRWLDALIQCADETGATQVGPLQFIGDFREQTVHIAGGVLHERQEDGHRVLRDEQRLFETKLKQIKAPLRRSDCDYIEFHCMLLRREFLESIGGLDEQFLSVYEHFDLALELRRKNKSVYFEPKALATYVPPLSIEWFDLPFFGVRWSEEWTSHSVERFRRKWGYDRVGYMGEREPGRPLENTVVQFVRGHRGSVAGNRVTAGDLDRAEGITRQEMELIVFAFLGVDHETFDLEFDTAGSDGRTMLRGQTAEEVFKFFDAHLAEIKQGTGRFSLRIVPRNQVRQPCLVQLQNISRSRVEAFLEHAFLVLENSAGAYDVWLAVSTHVDHPSRDPGDVEADLNAVAQETKAGRTIYLDRRGGDSHRLHGLNAGRILTQDAFAQLPIKQNCDQLAMGGFEVA